MFKKNDGGEEERCDLCVWARRDEEGRVFCRKKEKQRNAEDACSSFEYDLLKRRPAPFPEDPALFFVRESDQ